MTDEQKLQAIIARITGVFDDPYLMEFGPLSTDVIDDVLAIARGDAMRNGDFDND